VCINLLTLTCFYVPCDCSEKISISITILLSLSMFQLLLLDLVPATSLTIPLLGKYILFTNCVLCGSIICSVVSLNVHYRGKKVGIMGKFTKWFFLDMLAKLMCIQIPAPAKHDQYMHDHWSPPWRHSAGISRPSITNLCRKSSLIRNAMRRYT
jgi:nicotinic acetylcholine receptor